MEDLATLVADSDASLDNAEALLERWDGRPDHVIEDIFRVRDLESKQVEALDLTPYQRQFVHAAWYGDESTLAVLKGRRTGYSFITCCVILLYALTTPHAFVAITAPSKSQAKDRIEDIYDLIEWSPVGIETPVDNRDEIELFNGATIMAFSGNPDTSRGADSADILFVDEMAFLEDQEESMRAFSPFTALGDAMTVEISTPNTSNDIFMQDIDTGSPSGSNGIIAIEQPAFENADDIDVEQSLFEQGATPVMPYLDLEEAEKNRKRDPKGFEQEYLCKTVEDSYRFFTSDGIERAIARGRRDGYVHHPATHAREGGKMVMGVDLGADGKDDTALAVWEHVGNKRLLRFHTMVSARDFDAAGIVGNPENPSDLAQYTTFVANNMGVERVIVDKTGTGKGYWKELSRSLGRRAVGISFDDKETIAEMMGEFNRALHNDWVTMVPDDAIDGQLKAIVKEQTHETSQPRFTGKDNAPNGKDDLAIALVLGAYPPNYEADRATDLATRDQAYEYDTDDEVSRGEGEIDRGNWQGVVQRYADGNAPHRSEASGGRVDAFTTNTRGERTDRRYGSRHDRRKTR